VLYRTTRDVATAPSGPLPAVADLGLNTLIALNRRIPGAYNTSDAVYRITVKDDDDPATALARDERQEIKNVKGHTFELHVHAVREPGSGAAAGKVKEEFVKSCYYLDSDDAAVQKLARRAVGDETDPWRKAQAIEAWVHGQMRGDNSIDLCRASQVARNLKGDCRQHAMLTAAMCRAVEVPSRTAVGLIYVDRGKPVMGFHMWTEVWVKGQWLAIDATLGRGSVGAAHIKIADDSWQGAQSLTPLLPVARVLGKLSIEVVSAH
jgi:transglutaminase-like putative cysteine protease